MDGLTNIIAKIHEQNNVECQNILDTAESKAKIILDKATKDAEVVASKIESDTRKRCDIIDSKAISTAELEYKRAILTKKSEILDKMISDAVDKIKKCPENEYFGYIERLILSNALSGKGVLKMSQFDLNRIPSGFESKINEQLSDGMIIQLSNEPASFDGGFVIEYSEMRVDCTFESLINDKLDDIRDELSRVLFA